jgi:hypothetical protein
MLSPCLNWLFHGAQMSHDIMEFVYIRIILLSATCCCAFRILYKMILLCNVQQSEIDDWFCRITRLVYWSVQVFMYFILILNSAVHQVIIVKTSTTASYLLYLCKLLWLSSVLTSVWENCACSSFELICGIASADVNYPNRQEQLLPVALLFPGPHHLSLNGYMFEINAGPLIGQLCIWLTCNGSIG